MKLVTLLIGFVIFTSFLVFMFDMGSDMANKYSAPSEAELVQLESDYDYVDELGQGEDGNLRDLDEAMDLSQQENDQAGGLVTGAIKAGSLIKNSFLTLSNVITTAFDDLGIHPIFLGAIVAVLSIFLVLLGLAMLRGFKPEL